MLKSLRMVQGSDSSKSLRMVQGSDSSKSLRMIQGSDSCLWVCAWVASAMTNFAHLRLTPEHGVPQRTQDWTPLNLAQVQRLFKLRHNPSCPFLKSVSLSACVGTHRIIVCRALHLMQWSFYQASGTSCRTGRGLFVLGVFSCSCFYVKTKWWTQKIFLRMWYILTSYCTEYNV